MLGLRTIVALPIKSIYLQVQFTEWSMIGWLYYVTRGTATEINVYIDWFDEKNHRLLMTP